MKWVEDLGEGEHTKRENSISNGPEVEINTTPDDHVVRRGIFTSSHPNHLHACFFLNEIAL